MRPPASPPAPPPEPAPLPRRFVDVVFHPLPRAAADLAADADLLSAEERARAGRFRIAEARDRFVAARAELRRRLAARLGADPAMLALVDGPWGKPRLADPDAAACLSFNLSHSADWAAIALADSPAPPEIGVDIEATGRLDDLEGMARVALHPREADAWQALAAADRPGDFYRRWTRKEAVMKAVGLGFHLAPRGFALEDAGPGEAILTASTDPRVPAGAIGVADLAVPVPDMAGAVALVGARPVPRTVAP